MNGHRKNHFEIWSRVETGELKLHGAAYGLTFEDACKQLASESIDFWKHYARGTYRGEKLYPSEEEAARDGDT